MKKDNLKIDGLKGTWSIIDTTWYEGEKYHLLENEQHGEDAASIIVNENFKIVAVDVWNGFQDLYEME